MPTALPLPADQPDTLGYVRVSTDDQAGERQTSLADQRRAIAQLAQRLGRSVGQVFEDPGASGASAEGRPAFMALVAFCRAHPRPRSSMGFVVALNDSRWGRFRDPEESTFWRVELKRHGWIVRFAEGDETEDPLARGVLRTIHAAQASAYREAIRANAKRGARGTAAQGYWQNEAPFGYRREATAVDRPARILEPGQRKADDEKVRLVPGPAAEQALVRMCFERYAAGTASLGSLARELRRQVPGRKWAVQTLSVLLKNPAYAGHVVWCRRPHDAEEAATTRVRPRDQWVVAEHAHPALVSAELFAAVQARRHANRRELRRTDGGYALTGLLRCAQCGGPFIGGGGPKGPPGDPDRYRFYRCAKLCTPGTVIRRHIEPAVVDVVAQLVGSPDFQAAVARAIDTVLEATVAAQGDRRAALERQRDQLDTAQRRLVDALAAGALEAAEATPALAARRAERARVVAELEQLQFEGRRTSHLGAERERFLERARDFPDLARRLQGRELLELLRPWIAHADVDLRGRRVVLGLHPVPRLTFILSSTGEGPGSQHQVITRTIALPPARVRRAARA